MYSNIIPIVKRADLSHLASMKVVADAHRNQIGFLFRAKLEEVIAEQRAFVVTENDIVAGFVIYRHRKIDYQTTLSDICVAKDWQRQGLGKLLINALQAECKEYGRHYIQLKCPVDLPANKFYDHLGFEQISVEQGRRRKLNIWRLQIY